MSPRRRKTRKPVAPVRKTSRRWRVPPPLTHGPEPLEGGTILEELAGPLGPLLWQSVRDVRLWAEAGEEERPLLFSAGAQAGRRRHLETLEVPRGLVESMETFALLLGGEARTDALAYECGMVAHWAENEGLVGVALAFTQAKALLLEEDPKIAYEVGALARRRGEDARAETWFRRAVMLSRQNGDWQTYSTAFVSLGNLYLQRGNYSIARKLYVRARRAAKRHSLHAIEAMALHDLFVIASNTGETEGAETLAAEALAAYGPRHPRVPLLAHDVGYHLLELGYHARAAEILRAVLPHLQAPEERVRVLADTARAAAAAGDAEAFQNAWRDASLLVERPDAGPAAAQAMLNLAQAAAAADDWSRAESAARRSLELARSRNDMVTRSAADAALEAIRERRLPAHLSEKREPPAAVEALADRLVQRLS